MSTGRLLAAAAIALGFAGALVFSVVPVSASQSTASGQSGGTCIGRHPNESAIWYTGVCSGHDEPELDPVSSLAGSARDLTWTALPADGTVPVSAVGPTFWWGGTVTDPNPHSLFGQAYLELQFYPDSIVNTCSSDGGFNFSNAPDKFSVCPW
jgi:hypothetical protein